MERVAQRLDAFIDACGHITGWSSLAMVLVMSWNVLERYAFSSGSVAMQELEWHLMAPIALLSMAYAIRHDGHVRVDILYVRFSPRWRKFVEVLSFLLVGAIAALIVYLSIPYVMQSYSIGEGSPDPGGLPYRWLLKACIPVGFAFLVLQSLAAAIHAAIAVPAVRSATTANENPAFLSEHAAQ